MPINVQNKLAQSGISLIELVIFILILSLALTSITLLYINTIRNSADPLIRIKSIELAQLTLNEILLKKYDENSPTAGGCVDHPLPLGSSLCASGITAATYDGVDGTNDTLGPDIGPGLDEEGDRTQFDDVDDYDDKLYCGTNPGTNTTPCTPNCLILRDEAGVNIQAKYNGFSVCIKVSFAGGDINQEINQFTIPALTPVLVPLKDAKKIDVYVTDPAKSKISISAYSLNY